MRRERLLLGFVHVEGMVFRGEEGIHSGNRVYVQLMTGYVIAQRG